MKGIGVKEKSSAFPHYLCRVMCSLIHVRYHTALNISEQAALWLN
jgi:hypothetical protein